MREEVTENGKVTGHIIDGVWVPKGFKPTGYRAHCANCGAYTNTRNKTYRSEHDGETYLNCCDDTVCTCNKPKEH